MKIYDISQEVFGCQVFAGDPAPEKNVKTESEKIDFSKVKVEPCVIYGKTKSMRLSGAMIRVLAYNHSTILGGILLGRLLKIDRDTALMTSTGSAICGAAAVLGAEPVVKWL